ncbi:M20 aminoacylase family protein [Methylobrevis pamukkalensis]|uniref:Putative hydrolase YxeP n=1 Tax=Methylobrevis pamukkalensis TaxID=1439726 RepID=A0A1E3H9T8_9HYPH|nr:M20 aminoacylase family protein [Methylobrevis pamukkalensis]ODN72546.1 putative hydrolase YxeP [Methylobrevis pamukkalensis]
MPLINRIAETAPEIAAWRRHLHRHPELLYDVHETAAFVADKLRSFGLDEVATGIGRTGVVGVLHGRNGAGGPMIGLRSDMDALPIEEAVERPHGSVHPGKMHACGHDGHMAMLLGAAEHLASTRNFDGSIAFIFQPAEEGGAGAKAMLDDGLFERFPVGRVYGMHNMPGLGVGRFALRPGAFMASADVFAVEIEGRGGHAAKPDECLDPVLAGAAMVLALQQVVARNVDPLKAAVISVTCFNAGTTNNVIPQTARISGTIRSLDPAVRAQLEARTRAVIAGIASAHGVEARFTFRSGYPVTVNDPDEAAVAAGIARRVAGDGMVDDDRAPLMGAEDFAYMLERRPGAMIFVGNGASAGLHHPAYDFDDAAIPHGVSYWVTLAETLLPG